MRFVCDAFYVKKWLNRAHLRRKHRTETSNHSCDSFSTSNLKFDRLQDGIWDGTDDWWELVSLLKNTASVSATSPSHARNSLTLAKNRWDEGEFCLRSILVKLVQFWIDFGTFSISKQRFGGSNTVIFCRLLRQEIFGVLRLSKWVISLLKSRFGTPKYPIFPAAGGGRKILPNLGCPGSEFVPNPPWVGGSPADFTYLSHSSRFL